MKIDLQTVDKEQFMMHEHLWNGEVLTLIQPQHIGASWTQETKIFRSSVWNSDGELVSAGFPKFVNWGEKPDTFPVPHSINGCTVVEKLDGSLLIVSKYKGEYILRTRGTIDGTSLDNGYELATFKDNNADFLNADKSDTWAYSVLFEWTSPKNKIVLDYGDQPQWFLVGIVSHSDYSLMPQNELDEFAKEYGMKRPATFQFGDLSSLMLGVDDWKDKEGVVIYSAVNGVPDQMLHKVKAASYLTRHRFKENATFEATMDLYFTLGQPDYQTFEAEIITKFDYECYEMVRGFVSTICQAKKEVDKIVNGFTIFVNETVKPLSIRRAQAEKILSAYGDTNRSSYVFAILDGKSLTADQIKKLFYQVTKK